MNSKFLPQGSPPGERADPAVLRRHVEALEGERHFAHSPKRLQRAFAYVRDELTRHGWVAERQPFLFQGHERANLVARRDGEGDGRPRLLVGAHVDTVAGTPGADDNASGVAGLLEVARLLGGSATSFAIELAAWDQEERTGLTYRVGSRRQVALARRAGVHYAGALVLEMIGYRDTRPGSQAVPLPVRWMRLPRTGDFLAVVGDTRSRPLLAHFVEAGARAAPDLPMSTLTVPASGWLVWATRRSDNASFWSAGYPALLLTDTANLRNPHYHRATDVSATLDYAFMASVVDSVVETAASYGAPPSPAPGS